MEQLNLEALGSVFGIVATVSGAVMSAGTLYLRMFIQTQLTSAKQEIITCVETRAKELNDIRFKAIERRVEVLESTVK